MKLRDVENNLVGKLIYVNGKIDKDEITRQIEWLISNHLKKLATDNSGWNILFQDPDDERFWELTYPQSQIQGGGPPALICISKEEAKGKYLI